LLPRRDLEKRLKAFVGRGPDHAATFGSAEATADALPNGAADTDTGELGSS
jgi:hypothetical protein